MNTRLMQQLILILLVMAANGWLSSGNPCTGQESGNPFIRNVSAEIYNAHSQNFSIAQDNRGVMYFGNFSGILEYDGEQWRIIPTENITRISSLSADPTGTIYAGARGEIGYLSPDPAGNMSFVSLNNMIPAADLSFLDVTGTFAMDQGVYFVTDKCIFFYDYNRISVIAVEGEILSSFYIHDNLYFWVREKGLMQLENGQQLLILDQKEGAGILELKAMIPMQDKAVLIGTAGQGLYRMADGLVEKFVTDAPGDLTEVQITCGIRLPDDSYAFGTERQGVIIVEHNGKIRQVIDKTSGLRNETINFLYIDREDNLWAALSNGLALIETPSPIAVFDERNGISGGVTGITRLNTTLFVSTFQGLFYYTPSEKTFIPVEGITTGCWSIIPFDETLLAATSKGVYMVRGTSPELIVSGLSYTLCRSVANPSRVYAGQSGQLMILEWDRNKWSIKSTVSGIDDEIMEIAEGKDGSIWMNTPTSGLYLYKPGEQGTAVAFDTTNGLPYITGNHLSQLSSGMHLNTRQGLYFFNPDSQAFEVYPLFLQDTLNRNIWLNLTIGDQHSNLWTTNGDEKGITCYKGYESGIAEPITTPFLPVSDFVVWTIYPENHGIVWFGGPEGILRYDPVVKSHYDEVFHTLIRKVTIKGDSTIFWGTFFDREGIHSAPSSENLPTEIHYGKNAILFEYAAASYDANGNNEYQYFLQGFDKLWSEWKGENFKEYTNLPKGTYVFHVKSKNIYNRISNDSTFSFRILTPWYMLWWAYVLYALIISAIIYFIVLMRSRKLLKEKQALEEVIHERTAEVVRQKEEIEQKSMELTDKNYELERINKVVKSINEEIHFARLIESVLEKMTVIQGVEKALALVRDQASQIYRYKASYLWDTAVLEGIHYELEEAEDRFLKNALEVHEDIFIKSEPETLAGTTEFKQMGTPRSMVILVIKVDEKVEGILLLINMTKENAFDMRDYGFIKNSKEHIISAFIKTRILEDLQHTLENLKETQKQLIQSEKLASLGQLTAGIAHEIQNPLNFVNNFSSLSIDLTNELREYIDKEKTNLSAETVDNLEEVIGMLDSNVKKINEHGKRAERIVKGMLQHSRGKSGEFLPTDLNMLVEEYVNLSYHGVRAENKEFNATFIKDLDPEAGKVKLVPQDFSRVVMNIMNNACYAVFEKTQKRLQGYIPTITIATKRTDQQVVIRIKDNGTGIPQSIIDKIFNPFFTTKPTGKGTGLGLSMSYDIVTNIHSGKLEVISTEGESTEFIITLPDKG